MKKSNKPTTKSPASKHTAKPRPRPAQSPAQVLLPIIERLAQSAERLAQAAERLAERARVSVASITQQQSEQAEGEGEGAVAIIIEEREGEVNAGSSAMPLMMEKLYDALLAAHAPDEKARATRVEAAQHELHLH